MLSKFAEGGAANPRPIPLDEPPGAGAAPIFGDAKLRLGAAFFLIPERRF
jgi:hypothetical protein